MVERTISVGFHSNFGVFKRKRHSKTLARLAITYTNEFPFNPTYGSQNSVTNLARFFLLRCKNLDAFPLGRNRN